MVFSESSSPVNSAQLTPSQFSEGIVQDSPAAWKIFHQCFISSGSAKGSLEFTVIRRFEPFRSIGETKPGQPSSAISSDIPSTSETKSSLGMPRLFPLSRHIKTPLCKGPGTFDLSRSPLTRWMRATISTFCGHALSHFPHMVHFQGH